MFNPVLMYQYNFIAIDRLGPVVIIVAGSMLDPNAINELERIAECKVQAYIGLPSEVNEEIAKRFPDRPPPSEPLPPLTTPTEGPKSPVPTPADDGMSSLGSLLFGDD